MVLFDCIVKDLIYFRGVSDLILVAESKRIIGVSGIGDNCDVANGLLFGLSDETEESYPDAERRDSFSGNVLLHNPKTELQNALATA